MGHSGIQRARTRDLFNEQEPKVSEPFEKYDWDGSGAIEFPEMKELLKDLQGGAEPSDQDNRAPCSSPRSPSSPSKKRIERVLAEGSVGHCHPLHRSSGRID